MRESSSGANRRHRHCITHAVARYAFEEIEMSDAAQVLTFTGYSPARFAKLEALLVSKGFEAYGNEGDVKEFGADVRYAYDGKSELTLLVRSAPHFHSMAGFVRELSKAVNGIA